MPRIPRSHNLIESLEPRTLLSSVGAGLFTPDPSLISGLTANGGKVLFFNNDGARGMELWSTDGTQLGTFLVKDIRPGPESAIHRNIYDPPAVGVTVNGYTYFVADDGIRGKELWRSDGTAKRTTLVKNITRRAGDSSITDMIALNDALFFFSSGQLWTSDGTADGTVLLYHPGAHAWAPGKRVVVGNTLFFLTGTTASNTQLWKSDGTVQGTTKVMDTGTPADSVHLATAGGKLFMISDGACRRIDPASATATELVADVPGYGTYVATATSRGELFFLRAELMSSGSTACHNELWVTDGSPGGTRRVFETTGSVSSPEGIWAVNDAVVFTARGSPRLYRSDGTVGGTAALRPSFGAGIGTFTSLNGRFYFEDMFSIWTTDGTDAGTHSVATCPSDPTGHGRAVGIFHLTAANGRLFYSAPDAMRGEELWTFTPSASKKKNRRVRALTPSWSLRKGRLAVDGTRWSDNIQITADPAADTLTLVWNGIPAATLPLASVSSVRLSGGLGHDLLALSGPVPRATLNGDAGGDTLRGGTFADLLIGGPDLDRAYPDAHDTRTDIEMILT